MYADRNNRGRVSPGSLVAALAINAAVLAALVTASPEIWKIPERPFEGYTVPIEPPPPPNPEQNKPTDSPKREATPTVPRDPVVPVPRFDDPVTYTDPGPMSFDLGPLPGTGGGTGVKLDPPAPPPVLVDAAPDPRYANDFQPDYPPAMRRAGTEGVIAVRVLVGADGRVKAIEPVRGIADFFEVTRRQALARWRFRPATRDGVAYESWRTMTVRFRLEE